MSISSSFLWRFLDDVWDLLPTEDRQLFETYWSAQLQIAANLEQKTMEAALSDQVATVPVFLTERWNSFVMNDESCDLFTQTDALLLSLLTPSSLSRATAFFDTLSVSTPSGQIAYEEDVVFFDDEPKRLRYGKLIAGTISVRLGAFEFVQNRDYAVNLEDGTIQALPDGRIPPTGAMTVRYQHREFTLGLDYTVDEIHSTISRTAASAIASGDIVTATYTYNATATIPISGTAGSISGAQLTDPNKNFNAVLEGHLLTIASGPNAGVYTVSAVVDTTAVIVAGGFVVDQATDVTYSIDAFPHGVKIPKQVVSIPTLRNLVDDPTVVYVEGVDYIIQDGILSCRAPFPLAELGPKDLRTRQMWAEVTKIDNETPYRNFGVLIDFYRKNSEAYKLALQGLWYTFWTGSTPGNLQRGLHILLGLPFAKRAGTVTRVDTVLGKIDVTDARGQILTYTIPTGLTPTVEVGDELARFASMTTGVSIIDRNNDPGFVESRLGRAGVARFLTTKASRGVGDTDETKALKLLEHHLFLPQVLTEAIVQRVNVGEIVTFLDAMKPKWTQYVFSFAVSETEGMAISEEWAPNDLIIDLSTTVSNNEWNQSFQFNNFVISSTTGEILGAGSQATGNFRDLSNDFTATGTDRDDIIRIATGPFAGIHNVIKRISAHVVSIDIPDALLQSTSNIDYVMIPSERKLDHDSINIGLEHIVVPGTTYLSPTSLNTKTDAALSGLSLRDAEICALLLVDANQAGAEVQSITAANKSLGEITVATPPTPGASDHEIASCALVRTDNSIPAVTDAFAI